MVAYAIFLSIWEDDENAKIYVGRICVGTVLVEYPGRYLEE